MPHEEITQVASSGFDITLIIAITALVISFLSLTMSFLIIRHYIISGAKSLKQKAKNFLFGEKLYKQIEENGLNVLVETEGSKAKTEKRRFLINVLLTFISALAAVVAAIFAALTYINA